jgi:hypothetical protein
MYENEKMRLVETIAGMEVGGERVKENEGGDDLNYDIL